MQKPSFSRNYSILSILVGRDSPSSPLLPGLSSMGTVNTWKASWPVAGINSPLLDRIQTSFSHQLVYDIPQLAQFMRHTTRFQALNEAHVNFGGLGTEVGSLSSLTFDKKFRLKILCYQ